MKITQKKIMELFYYDQDTGIFTNKHSGKGKSGKGKGAGYYRHDGYVIVHIDGKNYLGHRLAWLYVYGYLPENNIDHIDGNPRNNVITNLREVSQQCNLRNSGNRKDNTSGVRGVNWDKLNNRWLARININGIGKNLGRYNKFRDAVKARLSEEKKVDWPGCNSSSPAFKYINGGFNE